MSDTDPYHSGPLNRRATQKSDGGAKIEATVQDVPQQQESEPPTPGSPYIHIEPAHREIRLLELLPGGFEDDLVINMRVKRLERKHPKYNALSYVWGKQSCPRQACLNGRKVSIGRNLDCALRHLRERISKGNTKERALFWIDALCINQDDVQERNRQVKLMGKIYSYAEQVVVWLGPERSYDEFALRWIESGIMPQEPEDVPQVAKVLKWLCRRPWFGRMWIAQELALAKSDPTLLLGRRELQWSKLYNYVKELDDQTYDHEQREAINLGFWECTYWHEAAKRVIKLGVVKYKQHELLNLQLERTTTLLATDPRDKVFGLLSICRFASSQATIVADYSKTVQEVFSEATASMLHARAFPYIDFPLQPPRNTSACSSSVSNLPSWVFDLTVCSAQSRIGRSVVEDPYHMVPDHTNVYSLGENIHKLPLPFKITHNFTRLTTVGSYIGTVVKTSRNLFDTLVQNWSLRTRANALYETYNTIIKPYHISPKLLLQAMTRDGDIDIGDTDSFEYMLNNKFGEDQSYEDIPQSCLDVLTDLHRPNDSIVFITAEKHLGMVYHPDFQNGIQPGDIVVGLFGINFPFILRPVPGGIDRKPAYNMINVAYIANHNYGHDFVENAPPKTSWRDLREFGLQDYIII